MTTKPAQDTVQADLDKLLAKLPDGAPVAIVSMLGSLCPVHLGHVQCYDEARRLLLGEELPGVKRPAGLEKFSECLGFISLNGDSMVGAKLEKKGQKMLKLQDRAELVRLATAERPWLNYDEGYRWSPQNLSRSWPKLQFVEFDMNGADDVLKYRKWQWTGPQNRMITMGRPGYTEAVKEGMRSSGLKLDDGNCILGPELPDVSSTAVRDASVRGDGAELLKMLHPAVADWLLRSDGHRGGLAGVMAKGGRGRSTGAPTQPSCRSAVPRSLSRKRGPSVPRAPAAAEGKK
eukprot:gnl/TRDRNA2_/TRDRNA2_36190_c0_seq1.p1 gnl/TRDRNA2_/TRDRNA2_36190_c0~~gnl/TRDRNA2_/TRDRNA2_36190_c0_seq1.p1  ORF type:complete len:290 (-),score=54.83 gnl/TRDRNA2_/TRDRNA2_36190_c0_seq1:151-1020(-)